MPLLAAIWVLLVLFTVGMAIRQSPNGPRPLGEVLRRLGLVVLGVVVAVPVLATVAATAWVIAAEIRNGPDDLCGWDMEGTCQEANEERRTERARKHCAGKYDDAAEAWAEQRRVSLDGTWLSDHDGDGTPDRRAFISACMRDQ